jgi:hypothetical protein
MKNTQAHRGSPRWYKSLRLWIGPTGLLLGMLTCAAYAPAQVQLEWKNRPKDPKQSVSLPDQKISKTQLVTFTITDVNDIFYDYTMTCTKVASESVDFSGLLKLATGGGERALSACDSEAADLITKIKNYLKTPTSCGANCNSVPVAETTAQISTFITSIDQLPNGPTCTVSEANKKALADFRAKLSAALGLSHQKSFQVSVDPGTGYSCTISEFSKMADKDGNYQPTKDGTFTITIGQTANVVTLSLGPLFSAVQNRTYSAVTVPNSDSSGTNTVLGVQGKSLSTSIAALVNLRLPVPKLSGEKFGLDIAAGPVLRLNPGSGTSPAGFFGGISLRFYRYLFITPGFHVAQFADFPQGFSQAGQKIPPNFGTLTPVTRTTVKFGLAITFQTKDFSSLSSGKTSATSTTTPPAKTTPAAASTTAKTTPAQPPSANP